MHGLFFKRDFEDLHYPILNLLFNKNMAEMPGADGPGWGGQEFISPPCLVINTSGYFSVVSYLYTDGTVRMFTDGDMPRPDTDFVAWALLPDLT